MLNSVFITYGLCSQFASDKMQVHFAHISLLVNDLRFRHKIVKKKNK